MKTLDPNKDNTILNLISKLNPLIEDYNERKGYAKPEPKKSLADVLRDAYQTNSGENKYSIRKCYESEAKAAREYIYQENMEKLEAVIRESDLTGSGYLFSLRELREVLK